VLTGPFFACKFGVVLFVQFYLVVAVAAVNWPVFTGLEGYFSFLAALGAHYGVHLPRGPVAVSTIFAIALGFPGSTAIGTTFRLVLEATRSIEFLLSGGEGELASTVSTLELLVLKAHWMTSSLKYWFEFRPSNTYE
jgi:hypothetical protein